MSDQTYRVKGWDKFFESAKSKTYGHKQQTYMPNKHGLGYKRLLALPNGEAIFGAWCSMCQVLSRQNKPRRGYLTDNGKPNGVSWTADDIALMTGFAVETVSDMLANCQAQEVDWLEPVKPPKDTTVSQGYHKDTARIPQSPAKEPQSIAKEPHSPYPLPSPSPSQSPPPGAPENPGVVADKDNPKPPRKRNPDVWWDTVCEVFSLTPITKSDKSRIGKLKRDFQAKCEAGGFHPPEINLRRLTLASKWPNIDVTPEALLKWWDMAGGNGQPMLISLPSDQDRARQAQAIQDQHRAARNAQ